MSTQKTPCQHCEPGMHKDFDSGPWSVWVGPRLDGDGQPVTLTIARSDGAHVAESDAETLRALIRALTTVVTR